MGSVIKNFLTFLNSGCIRRRFMAFLFINYETATFTLDHTIYLFSNIINNDVMHRAF